MIFRKSHFINFRISDSEISIIRESLESNLAYTKYLHSFNFDDFQPMTDTEFRIYQFRVNAMLRQLKKAESHVEQIRNSETS